MANLILLAASSPNWQNIRQSSPASFDQRRATAFSGTIFGASLSEHHQDCFVLLASVGKGLCLQRQTSTLISSCAKPSHVNRPHMCNLPNRPVLTYSPELSLNSVPLDPPTLVRHTSGSRTSRYCPSAASITHNNAPSVQLRRPTTKATTTANDAHNKLHVDSLL